MYISGLYVSGLVLYGRILSQSEMTSLSQTCGDVSSDEMFTMTDMLPNIVDGIAIITPTSCDRKNSIYIFYYYKISSYFFMKTKMIFI